MVLQSIEEIKSKLTHPVTWQERIDLLTELAYELRFINLDEAIETCRKAGELAQEYAYKKGTAKTLRTFGILYRDTGRLDTALLHAKESLILFAEMEDLPEQAQTQNVIGGIYFSLGDYERALTFYNDARQLKRHLTDHLGEARILLNIGLIYLAQKLYERAIAVFLQSISLRKGSGDLRGMAHTQLNLGRAYSKFGNADKAESAYLECQQVAEQLGDETIRIQVLMERAEIAIQRKQLPTAKDIFLVALNAIGQLQDDAIIGQLYIASARFFLSISQLDKALELVKQGYEWSKRHSLKEMESESHFLFSRLFELKEDYHQALYHFERYHVIDKELVDHHATQRLLNLQTELEVDTVQNEVEIFRLRHVELVETNRALAEATKSKSEILSIAAHDLKNPLGAIINFCQLLSDTELPDRLRVQYVSLIHDLSIQIEKIIEDMGTEVAGEERAIQKRFHLLNISQLIKLVVVSNEPAAKKKAQKIQFEICPEAFVMGDDNRLKEVFDNLVSNAIKYTPFGKKIQVVVEKVLWQLRPASSPEPTDIIDSRSADMQRSVGTSSGTPCILISIRDEGQGLSKVDFEKIFKKYQRLSSTPTSGESSTGLGLSIVKRLVEIHGGKVWASSLGKNMGSTFYVCLPESNRFLRQPRDPGH